MAGPELFGLADETDSLTAKRRLDALGLVSDHHDRLGNPESPGQLQWVVGQRSTGERVQNLRQGRFHPGSLAGGQNDGR
jgi:hypothetical protein